ncbi:hypothetical protein TNCV_1552051 [Trichonephila clavipes]|nr:hypothetical protein TNCV_1552051 [Trichonephila clavipes]
MRAVGSLGVRASDSRLEGVGLMPDATEYPPSTHVKSEESRKSSGRSQQKPWVLENIYLVSRSCINCGDGDG